MAVRPERSRCVQRRLRLLEVGRALTATVARVSPNPKRVLDPEDETAIREALTAARQADQAVRNAVLTAALHGASVRSLAEFTGMSTNTIHRWKMEARQQP